MRVGRREGISEGMIRCSEGVLDEMGWTGDHGGAGWVDCYRGDDNVRLV